MAYAARAQAVVNALSWAATCRTRAACVTARECRPGVRKTLPSTRGILRMAALITSKTELSFHVSDLSRVQTIGPG